MWYRASQNQAEDISFNGAEQRLPEPLRRPEAPGYAEGILAALPQRDPGLHSFPATQQIGALEVPGHHVAYHGPDGVAAAAAHLVHDGQGLAVKDFAADKGRGLLGGKAAVSVGREIERLKAARPAGTMSPDAQRLLQHSLKSTAGKQGWLRFAEDLEGAQGPETSEGAQEGEVIHHTTSLGALPSILAQYSLVGNPYVSLGARPVFHDIGASEHQVVITLRREAVAGQTMPVDYSDDWYDAHPDHAAYVAGGGWQEQYEEPEEAYDEDGWGDEDALEDHRDQAQRDAFHSKSQEQEWVSQEEGQEVSFAPDHVVSLACAEPEDVAEVQRLAAQFGLNVPVTATSRW